MNTKKTIGLLALSIATTLACVTPSFAAPDEPRTVQDEKEKSPTFQGKVEAVDATANTLTVDGTVLSITTRTKLTRADKPIKLADIKAGDRVQGTLNKGADGKTEALTVKVAGPDASY